MNNFLVSLLAILIFLFAAYGWGRMVVDRLFRDHHHGAAFTSVFGMGVWVFIGGILNAARIAYPTALDAMVVLGIGFAIFSVGPNLRSISMASFWHGVRPFVLPESVTAFLARTLPLVLVGVILVFLVMTLMPVDILTTYDDFLLYLPRPVRMLGTGSLGGNPFDLLGFDSLGAQAFMQSFFVSRFSLRYINSFDAISCFVLCLLLLWEMGRRLNVHWSFLLASLLVLVVLPTQYVNVSSIYSGTLMILAMMLSCVVFADDFTGVDHKRRFTGALAVALFTTSLVAFKSTFTIFAVSFLAAYFVFLLYLGENWRGVMHSAVFFVFASLALVIPWALVSLPNYVTALHLFMEQQAPLVAETGSGGVDFLSSMATIFSLRASEYGGKYLTYSILVSSLAVAGVVALALLIKSRDLPHRQRLVVISAACIATVIHYLSSVYLQHPDDVVRYSLPILAAVMPATLLLFARSGIPLASPPATRRPVNASAGAMLLLGSALAVSGVFSTDLVNRVDRTYRLRTQITFDFDEEWNRQYNIATLGKSGADWARIMQHKIGEGQPVLAILHVPFQLDYARNPIYTVVDVAFISPWFDFPLTGDPEAAREYLIDRGIRHVMYRYQGAGIRFDMEENLVLAKSPNSLYREIARRSIGFTGMLRYLAENSRLIYIDKTMVIFDISRKVQLPFSIPWDQKPWERY